MKKLTYMNDQQIVNDAAQMLIEAHLRWSGSAEEMPSRDLDNIGGAIWQAYLEANYTVEEWDALNKNEKTMVNEEASILCRNAKQLADQRWEAVITLLGI